MLFIAAATAAASKSERVQNIPAEFWVRMGLGVLAIVAVVIVLRKLAKVNKVVLGMVILVTLSIIGFKWIYERNEPMWARPAVQWLSQYFPTKVQ